MDDILGSLFAALLGDRWLRWRSSRRADEGDFDCALRADGQGWEHGRARISPGLLVFRRQGVRMAKAQGRHIAVRWIGPDSRRPSGRESWGITPRATIYRIDTSEGLLDWAVVAPSPEAAVRSLQPGE